MLRLSTTTRQKIISLEAYPPFKMPSSIYSTPTPFHSITPNTFSSAARITALSGLMPDQY